MTSQACILITDGTPRQLLVLAENEKRVLSMIDINVTASILQQ